MSLCFATSPCLSLVTDTAAVTPNTLAAVLQCFAAAHCLIEHCILPDVTASDSEEFDFIIIGAGSAGSVVANRLSEVENWKILLLEAGGDPPITSDIPGLHTTIYGTEHDWQYLTVNNGYTSQALTDGSVNWPRGKMLGGSSSMNAMMYVTGNDHDYQRWYDAGNEEWSIEHVQRCFKKAESLQNAEMSNNLTISEYYGHSGPQKINKFNSTYCEYSDMIIESWDIIGFKKVPNLKEAGFIGSGKLLVTADNGTRQSTNKAYLQPIISRKNLIIMKNTLVKKILINDNSTAYGVEVEKDGKNITFYSSKEVILSAGSVNSPQLLMMSGVGPREHLQSHDVTCIVDSPKVGQNLQDHALVPITIYGDTPAQLTMAETLLNIKQYLFYREGILAQSGLISDTAAFYSTVDNASYANIQNHVTIINKNSTMLRSIIENTCQYNETVLDSIVALNEDHAAYIFELIILHPYSRGNISLSSNDPKDHPLIHANYFEDTRDLDIAVTGMKMATKILNTPYFKHINGFLGRIDIPSCNQYDLFSEDYCKCICINMVATTFHPVGTCQMGYDINSSVVDSRLKVHGVKNLRVIDAGVMPTITSGNTNAPCIMIGERASELIKEDYNKL